MQWTKRDADALCVQLFNRLPQLPVLSASASIAGAFAATTIVPAVAGRFVFVDKLQFSVDNTGQFWIDDSAANLYGSAALPVGALGGVEHVFERLLWTSAAGLPIRIGSPSAGSNFGVRVVWRYV